MEPVPDMIMDSLNKFRIILASSSPRRQQLLKEIGLNFDIVVKDFHETFPEDLKGDEIALFVAKQKADLFRNEMADNEIVITADTIVWCNSMVLGKPSNEEDAKRILKEISGNTHEVITAVCILSSFAEKLFSVSTKVTFGVISDEDIEYYIRNFNPFDKAGAYGIQEWIGIMGCSSIEGSYFNVVGLPVHQLYKELRELVSQFKN
jgi:septum formation protein